MKVDVADVVIICGWDMEVLLGNGKIVELMTLTIIEPLIVPQVDNLI